MPPEKACAACGKPFQLKSVAQKYCPDCQQARVRSLPSHELPQQAELMQPGLAEDVRRLQLLFNALKLRIENIEAMIMEIRRGNAGLQKPAPQSPIQPMPTSAPKPLPPAPQKPMLEAQQDYDYSEYVELVERQSAKPAQPLVRGRLEDEKAESERLQRLQGLADTLDRQPAIPGISPDSSASEISAKLEEMARQRQEAGGEGIEKAARKKGKKRWTLNIFHR